MFGRSLNMMRFIKMLKFRGMSEIDEDPKRKTWSSSSIKMTVNLTALWFREKGEPYGNVVGSAPWCAVIH